jgi:hypothetical protein
MRWTIEFKPQDLWIGCYWKKHPDCRRIWYGPFRVKMDLWICIIPTLPIHLMFGTLADQKGGSDD